MLEFIEKSKAGLVEVTNVESWLNFGRRLCVCDGGEITLVLTFVLLSTHLIII
jgi:hypothetical protein